MHAFWCDGYEACSMQKLLQATGLSKSSIYQTFGGKHALFTQCLSLYQQRSAENMADHLRESPTGMHFLRQTMSSVVHDSNTDTGKPRGCFMMNTASEMGQTDPEIAKVVNDSLVRFRMMFKKAIERAQTEGDIARDKCADHLAAYLVTCMGGLRTMVKAGGDKEMINHTVEIMLGALP